MLEPDEGKLSSPVLRGLAPSNGGWLLGSNAKQITCVTRSEVLVYFAFSGTNNAASAFSARKESPGSRVGGFTIASPG
jgi:hypothetical protein